MTAYTIRTPVAGYTGVSAGVNFTNGVAVIDGDTAPAALAYFRAQGYGVAEGDDRDPLGQIAAPDPVDDGKVAQLEAENAALRAEVEQLRNPAGARPAKSATKEAWRAYAKAAGMDATEADSLSRDELAAHYNAKETTNG